MFLWGCLLPFSGNRLTEQSLSSFFSSVSQQPVGGGLLRLSLAVSVSVLRPLCSPSCSFHIMFTLYEMGRDTDLNDFDKCQIIMTVSYGQQWWVVPGGKNHKLLTGCLAARICRFLVRDYFDDGHMSNGLQHTRHRAHACVQLCASAHKWYASMHLLCKVIHTAISCCNGTNV